MTRTTTRTATRSPTITPTAAAPIGPVITFLGLTRSDDSLLPPSGTTPDGVPFYQRVAGIAFSIVVEGKPGPNGVAVGRSSYQQDGSSFPDLEIAVSRPLGNGSAAVCDNAGATAGGVPAINPPQFDPKPATINAVNDFACRFVDGGGAPVARKPTEACVLFSTGDFGFVGHLSTVQFCGVITRILEFPSGDTLVTVRLLDELGNPGFPAQLIVRVGSSSGATRGD